MKECDNSKIHISSNFILSTRLIIMFDTLLLIPSLHCNTPLHFTNTSPNYTSLLFTIIHHTSPNYISLHFATLHHTSPHFTQLHYTKLIETSLPLIYTSLPFHLALRIYIYIWQAECSITEWCVWISFVLNLLNDTLSNTGYCVT
jgi:hypothetical protein